MSTSSSNTSDGQVAADLRAAADVLERDGWTQDVFHCRAVNGTGISHCALGALAAAVSGNSEADPDEDTGADWWPRWDEASRVLAAEIGRSASPGWDLSVPEWNDLGEQTRGAVVGKIRAAANRAERKAVASQRAALRSAAVAAEGAQ